MAKQSYQRLRGPSLVRTINGGSANTEFALFEFGRPLHRILEDGIDRMGLPAAGGSADGRGRGTQRPGGVDRGETVWRMTDRRIASRKVPRVSGCGWTSDELNDD